MTKLQKVGGLNELVVLWAGTHTQAAVTSVRQLLRHPPDRLNFGWGDMSLSRDYRHRRWQKTEQAEQGGGRRAAGRHRQEMADTGFTRSMP
jgi:hypothetical protein